MWSDILDLSFLDLSCDQELSRGQELNYREWTLIDPPIKSSKVVHLSVFTFKPPLPFFTVSKPTNQNTSKFQLWNCLHKKNFASNPYWQISGVWARQISGKLIQKRAFSQKWNLTNSWVWYRPISAKLIQICMNFPETGLTHTPIFYKNWKGGWKTES